MATPYTDPRTGIFYFRREIPEALRTAFGGSALSKKSLGTRDPAEAKPRFARANADFEDRLADARRRIAEGTLLTTPGAIIKRWCEGPSIGGGNLTGPQRLTVTLMILDAKVGGRYSASAGPDLYPPAMLGPVANTDWHMVLVDSARFEAILQENYAGEAEKVGSNWIRSRWHRPETEWMPSLGAAVQQIRHWEATSVKFSDEELGKGLLAVLDEKRPSDENFNRARLARNRTRAPQTRLRPTMRLKQLFDEWKDGNKPRPQTALEYEAAVNDFIEYAGDVAVSNIDPDMLYDYRDEAAKLPASMPRADRSLPFRARLEKHAKALPKCSAATLKKRIGALQALLTYSFKQRWTSTNVGVGITIVGYTKSRRTRRSFEDHELAKLFSAPLFVDPTSWKSTSRISDATLFWLFLIALTTGARLEEVGQVALGDVRHDGNIVYLDIDEYTLEDNASDKSVKTEDSKRVVPIHAKLIELGFLKYCAALKASGQTELFPDLKENSVGKRTKEASQRLNRIINRHVSADSRLVFHSLRHAFKAKGNDANLTDRTLDQICGHAATSTGGRYGSEPRVRTIYRELHCIDFSCIEWKVINEGMRGLQWETVLAGRSTLKV